MVIEKSIMNDLKAFASWLWSVLFDFVVLGHATGLLSLAASFLGVIYLYHRIKKIKIECKDAHTVSEINEIKLKDLRDKDK